MKRVVNWVRVRCGYEELSDSKLAKALLSFIFSFTSDYIH